MDPVNTDRSERLAQWQVNAGWLTAIVMLVARLTTVYWQMSSGSLNAVLFGQAVLKSVILIAVVVFYRRAQWPSYLLLAVWPIGFVYAWLEAHASLPVLALGLFVGIGLFLGVRGTRTLRALKARPAPAVQP